MKRYKTDLHSHVGHRLVIKEVTAGDKPNDITDIAIECVDCDVVLLDIEYDRIPDEDKKKLATEVAGHMGSPHNELISRLVEEYASDNVVFTKEWEDVFGESY